MASRPRRARQRSTIVNLPAPYGGWNARDSLVAMPPEDAIRLENFISDAGRVHLRNGYTSHATGVGTRVDSLMEYSGPTGAKLFAASSGGAIFEVTATATATSLVTGLTNGKFQHVMHGPPAGSYLVVCNGEAAPHMYDGSTWATASVTGCTAGSSTFIHVTTHQSRLWFAQKNTLDAWYLPVASISGAAQRLQLGPFCRKGGYLQAIASWTRDGGAGMDDQIVFITSEGEAVLYSGTDPTSSTLWAKVGTFTIPEPIGRRCFAQIGADLGLITSQGVVPLSSILPLSATGASKVAATDKINRAFESAYRNSSALFGWQVIEDNREKLLIVNVPVVENSELEQFVMNVKTGTWSRFTGIDAQCWSTFGDQLYFGGTNGTVYRYGGVHDDVGEPITGICRGAYTNLGVPNTKQFQMARPNMLAPTGLVPGIAVTVDYDDRMPTVVASTVDTPGGLWDTFLWDTTDWATSEIGLVKDWQTVNGVGSVVSVATEVIVTDEIEFNSVDIMFEVGGYL
jgi:hypothetical protein